MPNFYTLLTLSIFIFAAGCTGELKEGQLQLVDTNAKDEVSQSVNLYFAFDRAVVPDTMVQRWDSTQYIRFEPPIAGFFRWDSPTELIFSPRYELPPATDFTGTLTGKISAFKEDQSVSKQQVEFYTAPLKLQNVFAFWSADESEGSGPTAHIKMNFNYEVDPSGIRDLVEVSVGNDIFKTVIANTTPGKTITLAMNDFPNSDDDTETRVSLKSGLLPVGGSNKMDEKEVRNIIIPSPYKLEVRTVEVKHEGIEGMVSVVTSQEIQTERLEDYIRIEPEIAFTTETTSEGFHVSSDAFDANRTYEITILKGIKGKAGGELKQNDVHQIVFGKLRPSVQIASGKGAYLSGDGSKLLMVNLINVEKVKVVISKIYENNLMASTRYTFYADDYDESFEDYYYDNGRGYELGDEIWSTTYLADDLPKKGNARLLKLDFTDKIPNYNGIYHVKISADENYWLRDQRIISISDIGLITKAGKERVYVFANSIKTANTLSGVQVSLIGANNQLIDQATTNADGVAVLALKEKNVPGFRPALVTARLDDDFNYLPFSKTSVNLSGFDVGGKRENPSGIDLFLYGEREIYRPGETVHIAAIARSFDWQTPIQMPVKVRLLLPNGRELSSVRKQLDKAGAFQASFTLSPAAVTGGYTLEVYSTNDVLMQSKRILVEEFMPDRIKVNTKLSAEEASQGEEIGVEVNAMSFFGPPAADRNYEMEFAMKRKYFSPEGRQDFNFAISEMNTTFSKTVVEGKTDQSGNAYQSYTVPEEYAHMGELQLDVFTTVFDETGRPVSKKDRVQVYTQDVFYGIRNMSYYHSTDQNLKIGMIAVDKNGQVRSGVPAKVSVIKHEYRTVWERSGSYYRYRSQPFEKLIESKEISINGDGTSYYFETGESGRYEIRVSKPGINSYVSQTFYCYGYGRTYNSSFEVNNEGRIDIELDKDQYEVNEEAKLLFKTPFPGKLLVTVENSDVIEHFYLQTDKRSATIELPVDQRYLPNVYVTATLFRAHEESEMPLTIAHGVVSMRVEQSRYKLPVSITAVEKSRSGTSQKISIQTKALAKLTIAVVDEGILQLTNYQTPDPYAYFYQKRALGVRSYDIYPYLFPETSLSISSVGGDGYDLEKRVNPLNNRRVNLVRFWSGILQADGSGNASFDVDIPKFSGKLRIMAVAFQDQAFASASTHMTVADPIVISTALPRFLSPGDTVDVPVTITNTTSNNAQGKATLIVEGPMSLAGVKANQVSVGGEMEFQTQFRLVANQAIGEAKVIASVDALGEKFTEEINMTIRPASPLLKVTGSGVVKGGAAVKLPVASNDFIESSVDRKLILARSPAVQFAGDLDYLVRYPYGCVEQTISSAFPQLYFGDLAKLLEGRKQSSAAANYNINEAIKKIKMMQLYNGGLSMWPSGGKESWWITAYAAHFLYEAKQAGFQVDEKLLDGLYGYLQSRLRNKELITYYYNRSLNKKIAPRSVAYSLYVLSMADKPQRSTMNYYKANPELLSLDARYLLAAAYELAGDHESYKEIIPSAFEGERADQSTGGSFYSYTRDLAIVLNVMLKVDPDNPQMGELTQNLTEQMNTKKWLNTQERVFGFLALGKMARKAASGNATAAIKVNGKEVGRYQSDFLQLEGAEIPQGEIELSAEGDGSIYYFWEVEGISNDGSYVEEDNYLKVRRKFYNRFGGAISGNQFRQNDLVVVKISIESAYDMDIENVVISDIIPAGFEIENPRIDEVPGTDWIEDKSTPTHLDIRDDRINFFVDVDSNKPQHYYYVVRAVSKGLFKMGPVSADAMYHGAYHSYHGGGTVRITDR